jgi:transitional endoplasmic reticulum ATPase
VSLDGAAIYSPYLGDAEAALREAFHTARQTTPAIVFLDEVDALVGARSMGSGQDAGDRVQQRVLSTLLNEMDGVSGADGVLVIGATNRADSARRRADAARSFRSLRVCAAARCHGATRHLELYARRSPLGRRRRFCARWRPHRGLHWRRSCRRCAAKRRCACCARAAAAPVAQPIAQAHFDAALRVVRPSLTVCANPTNVSSLAPEMKPSVVQR